MIVGHHYGLSDGEEVDAQAAGTRTTRISSFREAHVRIFHSQSVSDRRACLVVMILGAVSVSDMPVDMFPPINLPVVAVATFYSGMPPQQIETNITYHLERQFTLASGIDHMESRSLPGVSLIKVYFRPGPIRTRRRRRSLRWP